MLAVTCWGGIWSIGLATGIYKWVHSLGVGNLDNSFGALAVIGPTEELAKFLAFVSCYWFTRKQLNEPVDGMIYMSCVALGFSLIENYFYVLRAANPAQMMVLRLLISTPMHICFSAFMGLAFYLLLQSWRAWLMVPFAYVYASLIHGIFDLIIFNQWVFLVLLAVIRLAHYWTLCLLGYATAQSPFRKSLETFIASYDRQVEEVGIECLYCGNMKPKITYRIGKERIQRCECGNFITTKSGLLQIFNFFAALFRQFPGKYYWTPLVTGEKYSTLYEANWLSEEKQIAYFNLHDLSEAVEKMNTETIANIDRRWWFPRRTASRAAGSTQRAV